MAELPKIDLLKPHLERPVTPKERARTYLGISQIGHDCDRYVWYVGLSAKAAAEPGVVVMSEPLEARTARIFRMGDKIEELVVADLEAAGINFESKQGKYKVGPWIKGHSDGVVTNVPSAPVARHLLEVKSMQDKYFKAYRKAGSMAEYNTQYWVQANVYAHLEDCDRILFVVENKNDQARHYERARTDHDLAKFYLSRAQLLLGSNLDPERLGRSPGSFPCNWCKYREICHD